MAKKKKSKKKKTTTPSKCGKPYRWGPEINYYLSFVIPAIQGQMSQADAVLRAHKPQVMKVVRKLHKLCPVTPKTVYRGMMLEPEHVTDGKVGKDPVVDAQFVSYSEDRDIACWFSDRDSFMNSIGIGMRVDMARAQGYIVTAKPKRSDILFHWSWGLRFPWMGGPTTLGTLASLHFGLPGLDNTIQTQREVMLQPSDKPLPAEPYASPPCPPTTALDARFHYGGGFFRNPESDTDRELDELFADPFGVLERTIDAAGMPSAGRRRRNPRKSICWSGYERVPGTKPYTKGSCRKITRRNPGSRSTTPDSTIRRIEEAHGNLIARNIETWIDLLHAAYWPGRHALVWIEVPERLAAQLEHPRNVRPPTEGFLTWADQGGGHTIKLLVPCRRPAQPQPSVVLDVREDPPVINRIELLKPYSGSRTIPYKQAEIY